MEKLDKLQEHAKKAFACHEIWPAAIELLVCSDMGEPGEFCEVWLAVADNKIAVLKGHFHKSLQRKHSGKSSKNHDAEWIEDSFTSYSIVEIEKLKLENLVSCGRLVITVEGQDKALCYFTNGNLRKMALFERLFNKIKEGNALSEVDFQDCIQDERCPRCGLRYPEPERKVCLKCMNKRTLFGRVLSFVPRYKLQISVILLCMLASSLLNLAGPYIGGRILFDQVIAEGGKYHGRIVEAILMIVLTRFAALLISIAYGRINAGMTARVIFDLKMEVFSAMQRLSLKFYSSKQTGNLMTRINDDANHLQYFFHDGLPYFIVNCLNLAGIGAILLIMNWKLALLVFLPVPFIVIGFRSIFPMLGRLFGKKFRKTSNMNSIINDILSGVRVVKAFGKEASEVNRFYSSSHGVFTVDVKLWHTINTVFPIVGFCMAIGGFIVWGVGGWQVITESLTFGELMSFAGYMAMIYGPLEFMTHVADWWSSCMNSAQRIFEIIDAVPDVAEKPDAVRLTDMKGEIELRDVSFSYDINKPVLKDISFKVNEGEMLGLVGHTGAGKSTIVNLMSRLYDVQSGEILIDGINIKDIAVKDLRAQIGMVSQETFLFIGSISDNIRYARPEATMEEVLRAAKAANAHDFIMKLPDGYDTMIGAGGRDLSGGERQRLSIARAILHNPRILILDEATASVDTETERQIQEALGKLIEGRTTISIAHRLSTLRDANRLVVLENGKIAEAGTNVELLRQKGVYYKLYKIQSDAVKIKGVGE